MTNTVADHYAQLLARHYAWMCGDDAPRQEQLRRVLGGVKLTPGRAFDLGCGHGTHVAVLREMGLAVTAVDSSAELLAALRSSAGADGRAAADVDVICADLVEAMAAAPPASAALVVCLGDTLTHLPTIAAVTALAAALARALMPGGVCVLSFRDLSVALEGVARVIPVRSDDTRIMTAFLEYEPEHVVVTDIVHERRDGVWNMTTSAYRKLRLAVPTVLAVLEAAGLRLTSDTVDRGMHWLVVTKPAATAD